MRSMKSIQKIRQENFAKVILEKCEGNQTIAASRLGYSTASLVSRYISGSKDIGTGTARKIEEIFEYPEFWMDTDHGTAASNVDRPSNAVSVMAQSFKEVPVIGRAMGGVPDRAWSDGEYPVGVSDLYAEVASTDPNAFIVPVEGDSMYPKFSSGNYALVEPNTEPELEDDVLVKLGDGRIMIKRLISRRDTIRLASYNNPEIVSAPPETIVWMYYVAYPIPARKIKQRV
ncbi:S24 family peptidase [Herbaspirillum chlorophenolicum]|uniref:S24 family peptidase n=1 Tax=Herbaspirillum chlorophenolicum TaxID=211589 RepID=A0ABW8F5Y5_9BURK